MHSNKNILLDNIKITDDIAFGFIAIFACVQNKIILLRLKYNLEWVQPMFHIF